MLIREMGEKIFAVSAILLTIICLGLHGVDVIRIHK